MQWSVCNPVLPWGVQSPSREIEQALRDPKSQVGFGTSRETERKPKEIQLTGDCLVLCSFRQPHYEDLKCYSNLTYSAPDTRHREQTSAIVRVLGCGGKVEKLIFFLNRTQLCWSILFEKKCNDLARKSSWGLEWGTEGVQSGMCQMEMVLQWLSDPKNVPQMRAQALFSFIEIILPNR